VGYVPQSASLDLRFPISLIEVVLTGRIPGGLSPFHRFSRRDREAVGALLERVGIGHLADRQISDLSGGEFQKMLIARALAMEPRILLLDEPTASVDAASRDQIFGLLGELNRDMTIVLVTHDLLAISSQVRRLACLNGRMVYHGSRSSASASWTVYTAVRWISSPMGCPTGCSGNTGRTAMFQALFKYQFLQNAVWAGALASIVCGVIGVIIVEKKLVMMSGGIAHAAYGGVGLGYLLGFEPIVGAFLFSAASALGVGWIKRRAERGPTWSSAFSGRWVWRWASCSSR
jgi:energy-coupling factor transporter ATP-binding protein EcfA2